MRSRWQGQLIFFTQTRMTILLYFSMPLGAHSHRNASQILRHWLTYSQLFDILHLRNMQLGQGLSSYGVKKIYFLLQYIYFGGILISCWICSIISRYGIHGFPTLFLLNSTMRVRYHGPRTVKSLAAFYTDVSGVFLFPYWPTLVFSFSGIVLVAWLS